MIGPEDDDGVRIRGHNSFHGTEGELIQRVQLLDHQVAVRFEGDANLFRRRVPERTSLGKAKGHGCLSRSGLGQGEWRVRALDLRQH